MKSKIFAILFFLFLLVIFNVRLAWPDGDGPDRPLTAAEKSYFTKVFVTIDRALPRAPAQWTIAEKPSTQPPKAVPEKAEKGPFRAVYRGQWFNQSQEARQQQKLREYAMKNPPKQSDVDAMQQQMDALVQEQQKIMDELMKASQRNDKVGVQKAQEKLKALQQRNQQSMNKVFAGQAQAVKESAVVDGCLQVEVKINETVTGLKKAVPVSIPGVSRAFRVDDGNPGMKDCPYGKTVALLGTWDNGNIGGEYTYFRGNWREGLPHPSAKNMIVEVRASDQRAAEYLRNVKWTALMDLLVK